MIGKKNILILFTIVLLFSILLTLYSFINNDNLLYSFIWSFIFNTILFLAVYCLEKGPYFKVLGAVMCIISFSLAAKTVIKNVEVLEIIIFNFFVFSMRIKKAI